MNKLKLGLIFLLLSYRAFSQETADSESFDLQACVQFALSNHFDVQNAELNIEASQKKVNETKGLGLPQISGSANIQRTFVPQSMWAPANAFDKNAPADMVIPLGFGVNWQSGAALTGSQLLFDGSYFVGLKASKTYKELSVKSAKLTKRDVVEGVTKAYYTYLLNQVAITVLESQKEVLEQLLKETEALYTNGYSEKIDVQRVKVNLNNINITLNTFNNQRNLSEQLLKFQMNYDQSKPIVIKGTLEEEYQKSVNVTLSDNPNYSQRIEHQVLETQKHLDELNYKNDKMAYAPKLYATGTMGANYGALKLSSIPEINKWKGYGFVGLQLNVPIFSGFSKMYKIDQSKIKVMQSQNSLQKMEQAIDYEYANKKTTLVDKFENIKFQKENLELASEVYRVTSIKYKQGLVTNFETVSTKKEMSVAENNYYSALFESLLAYVDFLKANGTLYNEN